MSTNYYLEPAEKRCRACGHVEGGEKARLHIGKSSMGWHFSFQATMHRTFDEWRTAIEQCVLSGGRVVNEYGDAVSAEWFWEMVREKKTEKNCAFASALNEHWYCVRDVSCVDNTDFCAYEFS